MSSKVRIIAISLLMVASVYSCKEESVPLNLEQINSPRTQKIIAPGNNSIGFIQDDEIRFYYLTERYVWRLDKTSTFKIPFPTQGLLSFGMGTIAVLRDNTLYFYYLDSSHQWPQTHDLILPLPSGYSRVSAMRMPWQHGVAAVETKTGVVEFYYLDENKRWQTDETATFVLPSGIDDYIMLGGMDIGIISDNKIGVYRLELDGSWVFDEDMVLRLPENTIGVLSFDPGLITVLTDDNMLYFFEADFDRGLWIFDDTMNFPMPNL